MKVPEKVKILDEVGRKSIEAGLKLRRDGTDSRMWSGRRWRIGSSNDLTFYCMCLAIPAATVLHSFQEKVDSTDIITNA